MTTTSLPPADPHVSPPVLPVAAAPVPDLPVDNTPLVRRRGSGPRAPFLTDAMTMVALLALWVVLQALVLGGLSTNRQQEVLYDRFRADLAAATAPSGGAIEPGTPVALLDVPRLGQQFVVVEGTAGGDLLAGPGHRRDTALPGQEGVSLVYGRARTYGAPFAHLTSLRPGDQILATTQQGVAVFEVDGVRRSGDPVPDPLEAGDARLTLVTAEGTGRTAALAAGEVVYVDASLVNTESDSGDPFVAESGRPTVVPASETALGTDQSALPLLGICLAFLMAGVGVVSYASRGRPVAVVWVVALPVVVALAWATTDVVMRLLPNLM
jgi:sortase A